MNRIYKYKLEPDQRQMVHMPEGAKLLNVVNQGGLPVLFAEVDPEQPLETRVLLNVTTGEYFDPIGHSYVGTCLLGGEKEGQEWYTMHVYVYSELEAELFKAIAKPDGCEIDPGQPNPKQAEHKNRADIDRRELKRELRERGEQHV